MCNLRFRLTKRRYCSEINPRLSFLCISIKSNSYPIAKIASKLALGYNLDELQNYKIDFGFIRTNIRLCNRKKYLVGTLIIWRSRQNFRSANEISRWSNGIGRSFQEALHKATQSLEIKRNGLGADGKGYTYEQIIEKLTLLVGIVFFNLWCYSYGDSIKPYSWNHKIDMWFLNNTRNFIR
jgi:carbamoyl-phosphate synthase large subunit